jgi:hypothetical protein
MLKCIILILCSALNLAVKDNVARSKSAIVEGMGISSAAVGRPSTFTIHLLDSFGEKSRKGGEGSRLAVFTSPPPFGGHVKVRNTD